MPGIGGIRNSEHLLSSYQALKFLYTTVLFQWKGLAGLIASRDSERKIKLARENLLVG